MLCGVRHFKYKQHPNLVPKCYVIVWQGCLLYKRDPHYTTACTQSRDKRSARLQPRSSAYREGSSFDCESSLAKPPAEN